jgi:hypothetical protein
MDCAETHRVHALGEVAIRDQRAYRRLLIALPRMNSDAGVRCRRIANASISSG